MLEEPIGTEFPSDPQQTLAPSQRLHLLLLGVDDIPRARAFYEALGWQASPTGHAGFVKFDLGGYALCLISKTDLAADTGLASTAHTGFRGGAFVYLARKPEEVPAILGLAEAAGGRIVKPATRTPWGIAGYFQDPDGHLFEVDYERPWVLDDQHRLLVDELNASGS